MYKLRTNAKKSREALAEIFEGYADIDHLTNDLVLTVENTRYLWEKLTENKRSKVHSIAYNALFEIVKNSNVLGKDYYVSSPQMKAFLLDRFGLSYQQVLAKTCEELEKTRKEYLEG